MKRSRTRPLKAWVARTGAALGLAAAAALIGPLAAHADCSPPAVPNAAGSGLPGQLDPRTDKTPGTTLYGKYGFAGLRWDNCELGGPIAGNEAAGDPVAAADTAAGNGLMGIATSLAAASTGLHQAVESPKTTFSGLDDLVTSMAEVTRKSFTEPWLPAFLTAGACAALWSFTTGNRDRALATLGFGFLAIGLIAYWDTAPLTASHAISEAITKVVDTSDQTALASLKLPAGPSPATNDFIDPRNGKLIQQADKIPSQEAVGAIYVDGMMFRAWAQGETGTAVGPDGKATGDLSSASAADRAMTLFTNSAAPYDNAPKAEDQRSAYAAAVASLGDGSAHEAVKGKTGGRAGAGALALSEVVPVSVVRIFAEAQVLALDAALYLLPILGPFAAALLAVPFVREHALESFRSLLSLIIRAGIAGIAVAVHGVVTVNLFARTPVGVAIAGSIILAALMWRLVVPAAIRRAPSTVRQKWREHRERKASYASDQTIAQGQSVESGNTDNEGPGQSNPSPDRHIHHHWHIQDMSQRQPGHQDTGRARRLDQAESSDSRHDGAEDHRQVRPSQAHPGSGRVWVPPGSGASHDGPVPSHLSGQQPQSRIQTPLQALLTQSYMQTHALQAQRRVQSQVLQETQATSRLLDRRAQQRPVGSSVGTSRIFLPPAPENEGANQ